MCSLGTYLPSMSHCNGNAIVVCVYALSVFCASAGIIEKECIISILLTQLSTEVLPFLAFIFLDDGMQTAKD